MMRAIMVTVSALVALGRQAPLQAQHLHEGSWSGFAPGGAGAAASEFGYPLFVRFGGTLNQRVLLGIEAYLVFWDFEAGFSSHDTRWSSNVTATMLLYPSQKGGLFVKPGVGLSEGSASCGATSITTLRFGSTLGVGYDLRLGSNLYLTPNVDLLVLNHPNCAGTHTRLGLFFTLGVTRH